MPKPQLPIKLLLVEDNPGDVLLLRSTLETLGPGRYHVVNATSLNGAVTALAGGRFDAILLDLSLPDSRGLATIQHVQGLSLGVPIVVLTGANDETMALEAVRHGAEDYLVKGAADGRSITRAVRYALDRSQARAALAHSEQRYRSLSDHNPDAVVTLDVDGRFTEVNPAAERLSGYSAKELVGMAFVELCPPDQLEKMRGEFRTTLKRGQHDVETAILRRDGRRVDLVLSGGPTVVDGQVVGAFVIARDVTAHKQAEAALHRLNDTLEQRVAERTAEAEQRATQLRAMAIEQSETKRRERRQLARLLHDHVQQLLAAAKWKAAELKTRRGPKAHAPAAEIETLLDQAIAAVRSLTIELFPPILYSGGLADALAWLAEQFREKHGLEVHAVAAAEAEPASEDLRFLLFEAVRELLFNVTKHAGAKSATVTLTRQGAELTVTVEDHGVGCDPTRLTAKGAGFGLFSIQERLDFIGGHCDIDSKPGRGTKVCLRAPLAATIPRPAGAAAKAPAAAATPAPARPGPRAAAVHAKRTSPHTPSIEPF
jgi:PAS domain S-box-containing protein